MMNTGFQDSVLWGKRREEDGKDMLWGFIKYFLS